MFYNKLERNTKNTKNVLEKKLKLVENKVKCLLLYFIIVS